MRPTLVPTTNTPSNEQRRRLVIIEGPRSGTVFPLILKETLVGRIDSAHLVFDDLTVSRLHSRIVLKDANVYIEDLHSRDGTWVNGVAVGIPRRLENGDMIAFGDVVVTFAT
jgi:pSer/pThr/pTyr-binding forkhead associated (FHA) protein